MGPTSLMFIICKIICFNILRLATILFLLSLRFLFRVNLWLCILWYRNLPGEVVLHSKLPLGFLEPTALSIPYKDQILRSEVECLATEEGNMILFMYSLIFLSHTWLCQTIRIKLNCRIQKLRGLVSQWQWNILDFFYLCLEIVSSF